jgi:hypothetical protein
MHKFAFAATGAAVAVAAGLVGLAGPAAAEDGHNAVITRPTTAYEHATNQSAPVFTNLKAGREVTALCFTEGQELNGNQNWFRISLTAVPDGNTAFVHRDAISVGSAIRHC